jgi:hypothetical protein
LPADDPIVALLPPVTASAADRLELTALLTSLTICLDDIGADRRAWLSVRRSVVETEARGRATLYLHPDQITRDRPDRQSVLPGRQVWDRGEAIPAVSGLSPSDFRKPKAERCLCHHLLWIKDLITEKLEPQDIPRAMVEAFQEGWAVTVDGRLRRGHFPGYSVAERRASFSRLFSRAGVLLPEHWRVFHRLWEGAATDQEAVLALVRRLPRLARSGR